MKFLSPAPLKARIRVSADDFRVDEIPATLPEGEGEHLWLRLRKRDWNTDRVAALLARIAQVPRNAVGYAGLKDRHAVTTQWFSLQLPGMPDPDWAAHLPPELEVLESRRHRRKLKTGHLLGNRFELWLRDCQGDPAVAEAMLMAFSRRGVPNFFGSQRFGHQGSNLDRARAMFEGQLRVRDRKLRSLYLSAARAEIFNQVLLLRLEEDTWDKALPGDALQLHGRGSFFVHGAARADAFPGPQDEQQAGEEASRPLPAENDIDTRVRGLELHPTGPLWGRGDLPVIGRVAALERTVADGLAVLARGLEDADLEQERRALRMVPADLDWDWEGADCLRLRFSLPPGAYATTLLSCLADLEDAAVRL